jgi:hypothetical protein
MRTGMSNTMVRTFCTLKEAAEQLDATQEQVEILLRKGILREFRDGPHRLLRTADVVAIIAARDRREERRGRPQTRVAVRPITTHPGRRGRDFAGETFLREPGPGRSAGRAISSGNRRTAKSRTRAETVPERQGLSLREWLWTGLTQDRPITIALLSALVLLAISAAIAGACVLAGML